MKKRSIILLYTTTFKLGFDDSNCETESESELNSKELESEFCTLFGNVQLNKRGRPRVLTNEQRKYNKNQYNSNKEWYCLICNNKHNYK